MWRSSISDSACVFRDAFRVYAGALASQTFLWYFRENAHFYAPEVYGASASAATCQDSVRFFLPMLRAKGSRSSEVNKNTLFRLFPRFSFRFADVCLRVCVCVWVLC